VLFLFWIVLVYDKTSPVQQRFKENLTILMSTFILTLFIHSKTKELLTAYVTDLLPHANNAKNFSINLIKSGR
jgi:hypothetical protein